MPSKNLFNYKPFVEYVPYTNYAKFTATCVLGGNANLPKKYIINENTCICFWNNGKKTVSKRHEEDEFDKELGFLLACWQYYNRDLSKNSRKKILACIKSECLKDFLTEKFRIETGMESKKIQGYLASLKVSKNNKKIAKHMKEED